MRHAVMTVRKSTCQTRAFRTRRLARPKELGQNIVDKVKIGDAVIRTQLEPIPDKAEGKLLPANLCLAGWQV